MDIEFDSAKDTDNRAKHGLSLADAAEFDMAAAVVLADSRKAYGEPRYRAFARMDGKGYCLAFTVRPGAIRAISYRRAHDKELKRYGL